ncbi:MAG: glycosyltransferase family 4 protein [Gammaproteobacteria bacterium]|jgi:glycosyltransferase involved in cell wall biosynthesis|nr:glycosyl transferase [Gammaproteobacteria bacterium]MDP6095841.1 glycosyltransferase family 4 protein [Gammaproteobacteria bacterium]|tara:strand:+ start:590 stop:1825 length:1236 start_codon:yes stop_codon:yes gene_type:complete
MNILFIHQNFPGQFKFLAPALAQRGHNVVATTLNKIDIKEWEGVKLWPYTIERKETPNIHPWAAEFEVKAIRAEACLKAAQGLAKEGFTPDLIIAHHGWGESLFIKEIWPDARLGIYSEFFYHTQGADVGFDPEFPPKNTEALCRVRVKNINNLLHFEVADAGISPTHWQASTFPEPFKSKITVIHDGIDTDVITPNFDAKFSLNNNVTFSRKDEIITFVNRDLEPYRGYHIFMRALPEVLKRRPNASILIAGRDGRSYGAPHEGGKKWKDVLIDEVRGKISDADWSRVYFLGKIPYNHFVTLLQISSVHVYLTYPFVLSWSLLEAMSIGCSIVASDTIPVREAIQHNKTGMLVDFFDIEQLTNQICTLLDDKKLRKKLRQNARRFAQDTYDLKKVCLPKQLAWVERLVDI